MSEPRCSRSWPPRYRCSLRPGHTGRHALRRLTCPFCAHQFFEYPERSSREQCPGCRTLFEPPEHDPHGDDLVEIQP